MNKRIFLTAIAAAALAGCPSSPAPTDSGAADTNPPRDTGGTDTNMPMDDVGVDTGPSDSGVTQDCAGYCGAVISACTGDNAQFIDMADCMAQCTELAWMPGTAGETSGNTLACRIYHAGVAAGMPDVHCAHAGTTGGGVCGTVAFSTDTTGFVRVDRMGMPAVATALIADPDSKDGYNDSDPVGDVSFTFASDILGTLTLLHATLDDDLTGAGLAPCSMAMADYVDLDGPGPLPAMPACAAQQVVPGVPVVSLVVPDMLTINPAGTPGFPNGRQLTDPVIDVTLAIIFLDLSSATGCGGGPCTAASLVGVLNPPAGDVPPDATFPYIPAPHAP